MSINHRPKADLGEDRLPSLDGFRAVSVGLVLGAHCANASGFPDVLRGKWPFDGGLGVRFFFVISGFIITWLLMREAGRDDRVSLRNFWQRRAVRILPAYGTFLLCLALLQWLTQWRLAPVYWLGAVTFTSNYMDVPWLPSHVWSLAVEEQFYLLWPMAFALLMPWRQPRKSLFFLSAAVILCALFQWRAMSNRSPLLNFHSFLVWEDGIAFGCIGAILLWHYRPLLAALVARHRALVVVLALSAVAIPKLMAMKFRHEAIPGCSALQSAGLVMVVLWSQVDQENPVFRLVRFKPVVLLGLWSYSVYLWQQLFCSFDQVNFGLKTSPWWMSFPGWLAPSILCGMLSYYFIEQPIRLHFKTRRAAPPAGPPL